MAKQPCTSNPKLGDLAVLISFYGSLLRDSTRDPIAVTMHMAGLGIRAAVGPLTSASHPRSFVRKTELARTRFCHFEAEPRESFGIAIDITHVETEAVAETLENAHWASSSAQSSAELISDRTRIRTQSHSDRVSFPCLKSPVDLPAAEYKDRDV